jgi:hypothetical protein
MIMQPATEGKRGSALEGLQKEGRICHSAKPRNRNRNTWDWRVSRANEERKKESRIIYLGAERDAAA